MEFIKDSFFDSFEGDDKSFVFEVVPDVHSDSRGSFCEVLKEADGWNGGDGCPMWFSNLNWIRQINRSKSGPGVVRGCHAQSGSHCQGKLVEAVNHTIFDVITDARPNSKTFGKTKIYRLSPLRENKLWVPRGFLHAFIVPTDIEDYEDAVFQYYVDNKYCHSSEICVTPTDIIPTAIDEVKSDGNNHDIALMPSWSEMLGRIILNEKDLKGKTFDQFKDEVLKLWNEQHVLWYK